MIKPINKGILLEELPDKEKKTESGILIHSSKVRDGKFVKKCKVIATDSNLVKLGDKVFMNNYGPQLIDSNPNQYIAKETDILAIFE